MKEEIKKDVELIQEIQAGRNWELPRLFEDPKEPGALDSLARWLADFFQQLFGGSSSSGESEIFPILVEVFYYALIALLAGVLLFFLYRLFRSISRKEKAKFSDLSQTPTISSETENYREQIQRALSAKDYSAAARLLWLESLAAKKLSLSLTPAEVALQGSPVLGLKQEEIRIFYQLAFGFENKHSYFQLIEKKLNERRSLEHDGV